MFYASFKAPHLRHLFCSLSALTHKISRVSMLGKKSFAVSVVSVNWTSQHQNIAIVYQSKLLNTKKTFLVCLNQKMQSNVQWKNKYRSVQELRSSFQELLIWFYSKQLILNLLLRQFGLVKLGLVWIHSFIQIALLAKTG